MSAEGRSDPHTAGRSGRPKILQRNASSSCTHATPAGLPWGMPGMGLEMDGAVQHAPHPGLQSTVSGKEFTCSAPQPLAGPEHLFHDTAHAALVRGIHQRAGIVERAAGMAQRERLRREPAFQV